MTSCRPLLSIVLSARNADDPSLRALLGTLTAWDRAAGTDADRLEIIVVEWNPPSSRPGLRQSIRNMGLRSVVRILSVTEELHQLCAQSRALTLVEHLAWNVGIKRSKADRILVTRPGVQPTQELAAFVLSDKLEQGYLYRADVYETNSGIESASLLAASTKRIHMARETIDLESQKLIQRFQENFAVWGEPVSTGLMLMLTHFLLFFEIVLQSLRTRKWSNCRYFPYLGRVIARDFGQAVYLYRVRREAALFFRSLHLNAAGDFLLASKEQWQSWRGVPEYSGHSFLVDATFVLAAVGSGSVCEKRLAWPMGLLRSIPLDIEGPGDKALPVLTVFEAAKLAEGWRVLGSSFSFNQQNWGLGDLELLESVVGGAKTPV